VITLLGALACAAGALGLLVGLAIGLTLGRRGWEAPHPSNLLPARSDTPEYQVPAMRSGAMPEEWWDWHGREVTRDGLPPGHAARIADDILSSEP
jgi:hypothetical protein